MKMLRTHVSGTVYNTSYYTTGIFITLADLPCPESTRCRLTPLSFISFTKNKFVDLSHPGKNIKVWNRSMTPGFAGVKRVTLLIQWFRNNS